jgi:hypothetical protein
MELSSKRLKDLLKGLRFFLARRSWPCVFVPLEKRQQSWKLPLNFVGFFFIVFLLIDS